MWTAFPDNSACYIYTADAVRIVLGCAQHVSQPANGGKCSIQRSIGRWARSSCFVKPDFRCRRCAGGKECDKQESNRIHGRFSISAPGCPSVSGCPRNGLSDFHL